MALGADFTLAVIPDPQYLAASYPSIYNAQMQWVVNNKTGRNIPYVIGLGDNVDSRQQYHPMGERHHRLGQAQDRRHSLWTGSGQP